MDSPASFSPRRPPSQTPSASIATYPRALVQRTVPAAVPVWAANPPLPGRNYLEPRLKLRGEVQGPARDMLLAEPDKTQVGAHVSALRS